MAARPSWKGFVRFSLVSMQVKGYAAASSGCAEPKVSLNQLHRGCGMRVKYQKVCPTHGELKAEDIVSGYEFADDQYVVIDPDEVAKLRAKNERTIEVEAFVADERIDPRFYSGRAMYLTPDGAIGRKPYAMLHRLLVEQKKVAFATGVFSNRDQVLVLRPEGGVLAATFLNYQSEVCDPAAFEPEVPAVEVTPKELALARTLVEQLTDPRFDFSKYRDRYNEEVAKLVEAKVAGKEIIAAPSEDEPQVTNLLEALQRSVAENRGRGRPPKLVAPSTAARSARTARRRKSS